MVLALPGIHSGVGGSAEKASNPLPEKAASSLRLPAVFPSAAASLTREVRPVALFHWLGTQALCWKSSISLLTVCPLAAGASSAATTRIAS